MTQETPHTEAPASLADGLAAIAGELRAMAEAQRTEAGFAALMHAAVLFLLAGIVASLVEMVGAWQQGLLQPLPPARPRTPRARAQTPASVSARPHSARPDSARRPRAGRWHTPIPPIATEPVRPQSARARSASERSAPPHGQLPAHTAAPRIPGRVPLSKRPCATEPRHTPIIPISI